MQEEQNDLIDLKSTIKSKKRGGFRPNAGRPKGRTTGAVLERQKVEAAMKERIMQSIDPILNAQLSLAKGIQYLYVIRYEEDSKGKRVKLKPELVTNQEEIQEYLAGEYDEEQNEYHYITTEKPEEKAIENLIDRVFGKAHQNIGITDGDGNPLKIEVVRYASKTDPTPSVPGPSDL